MYPDEADSKEFLLPLYHVHCRRCKAAVEITWENIEDEPPPSWVGPGSTYPRLVEAHDCPYDHRVTA